MRVTAVLILTLASAVALADPQPMSRFVGEETDGRDWIQQPQQQPYSGLPGQTEGSNWRYSSSPEGYYEGTVATGGLYRQPQERGYINNTELWDWRKATR